MAMFDLHEVKKMKKGQFVKPKFHNFCYFGCFRSYVAVVIQFLVVVQNLKHLHPFVVVVLHKYSLDLLFPKFKEKHGTSSVVNRRRFLTFVTQVESSVVVLVIDDYDVTLFLENADLHPIVSIFASITLNIYLLFLLFKYDLPILKISRLSFRQMPNLL